MVNFNHHFWKVNPARQCLTVSEGVGQVVVSFSFFKQRVQRRWCSVAHFSICKILSGASVVEKSFTALFFPLKLRSKRAHVWWEGLQSPSHGTGRAIKMQVR